VFYRLREITPTWSSSSIAIVQTGQQIVPDSAAAAASQSKSEGGKSTSSQHAQKSVPHPKQW
jgi:hypothetical protein